MMMSSEEEAAVADAIMQERLLKKGKRTRQRVDAGEPRNSYASIPNFSSRPTTSLLHLAAASSNSTAVPNSGTDVMEHCAGGGGGGGLLVVQSDLHRHLHPTTMTTTTTTTAAAVTQQRHRHRHHFHHVQQQHQQRFDMGSDGEGDKQPSSRGDDDDDLLLDDDDDDERRLLSPVADDKSQLLREILQAGKIDGGLLTNGKDFLPGRVVFDEEDVRDECFSDDDDGGGGDDEEEEEEEEEDEDEEVEGGGSRRGRRPAAGSLLHGSSDESAAEEVNCDRIADVCKEQQQQQHLLLDVGSNNNNNNNNKSASDERSQENAIGEEEEEATAACAIRLRSVRGRRALRKATAAAMNNCRRVANNFAENDDDDDDDGVNERSTDDDVIETGRVMRSPESAAVAQPPVASTVASSNNNSSNSVVVASSSSSSQASVELKRARVENIISSMRCSPSRPPPETPQVNGCKKRKLYMPQQHDAASLLFCVDDDDDVFGTPCKQRRTTVEQDMLRHQLTQMQAQIAAIQHKLDLYEEPRYDGPSSESETIDDESPPPPPPQQLLPPPLLLRLGLGGPKGRGRTACLPASKPPTPELEPAHFIDEARRLVHEQQERLTNECKMASSMSSVVPTAPAEPKVAATAAVATAAVAAAAASGSIVPRPPSAVVPPNWETLADFLKVGMSSLIDDWVRRCAPKPTPSMMTTTTTTALQQEPCSSAATSVVKELTTTHLTSFHASMVSSVAPLPPSAQSERRSPRTKVIDRGRMGSLLNYNNSGGQPAAIALPPPALPSLPPPPPPPPQPPPLPPPLPPLPPTSNAPHNIASLFGELQLKSFSAPRPQLPLYMPHQALTFFGGGGGGESPEQSEALPLVVTPKKKRHKVTDTRITPRTVSRLLGQPSQIDDKYSLLSRGAGSPVDGGTYHHHHHHHQQHHHPPPLPPPPPPPIVPVSLPTSVAIPNPSLHQSDVFSPYPYYHHPPHPHHHPHHHHPHQARSSPQSELEEALLHPHHQATAAAVAAALHSSLLGIGGGGGSPDLVQQLKTENGGDSSDCNSADMIYDGSLATLSHSSTLTPMHLRKAKLMFFYVRYPSSAILKTYFPDIKFNKNNTAQLVKWFSNFREFFYIQMEKYARQALSEGCKAAEELTVTLDSEIYRVLNLHYNRNNHIEVPPNFRFVVEQTLREFFRSIAASKDQEQSWKKSIYKVIARLDDNLPDYFKSPNFLEQLE